MPIVRLCLIIPLAATEGRRTHRECDDPHRS